MRNSTSQSGGWFCNMANEGVPEKVIAEKILEKGELASHGDL